MLTETENKLYKEESIDFKKYLFKFLANWYWYVICLSITLTIAYMVNRYSEPTYTISSSVIIGSNEMEMGSINALISDLGMNRRRMRTEVVNEIAILKSYSMARQAIEQLDFEITYVSVGRREIAESKMYQTNPFIVIVDSNFKQKNNYPIHIKILNNHEYILEINDKYSVKQKLKFGESFIHKNFNFKLQLRDTTNFNNNLSNKYYFFFNEVNTLAKKYRGKLIIEPNEQRGSVLTLKINGFVPAKMAAYLNKLSEVYIQTDLMQKNKQAQNTIDFIDDQLQVILDSLNKVEHRLQKFRSDNQIFDLSQKGSILINDLNDLENRKMEYEIHNHYYNYMLDYLSQKEAFEFLVNPSSLSINNLNLEKLVEDFNKSISKLNRINSVTNEPTPNKTILKKELDALKINILEQVAVGKNLNQINQRKLQEKIILIEQEISKLPISERNLVNIEREYKLNNGLYTFLLEKRAEAGITKASNVSNNKILDHAIPENASMLTPKRSKNYMIALVLGLGIPCSIILLSNFMNTKIEDKKDVEHNTNVPLLGAIGHNDSNHEIPVYIDPKSALSESFRSLRTNLQYILREKDQKVIMITSTLSGEGKTFAAVNLAVIIAMASKKVLLVGLDLRKPSLHKIFDIPNEIGISNYLSQQSNYKDSIKETYIENLSLAPSGPVPPNPAELIETQEMNQFFEQCKKDFDYIIIDTPPLAMVTDAMLVSKYSDANIFMIRQKYSHKQVFELINKLEQEQKIKNMNILVNDLKISKYYGYNYGYNYGYGYGYGYNYNKELK